MFPKKFLEAGSTVFKKIMHCTLLFCELNFYSMRLFENVLAGWESNLMAFCESRCYVRLAFL
jgi:hypothetical protein